MFFRNLNQVFTKSQHSFEFIILQQRGTFTCCLNVIATGMHVQMLLLAMLLGSMFFNAAVTMLQDWIHRVNELPLSDGTTKA